jgi:hypothetical protein
MSTRLSIKASQDSDEKTQAIQAYELIHSNIEHIKQDIHKYPMINFLLRKFQELPPHHPDSIIILEFLRENLTLKNDPKTPSENNYDSE